MNIEFQDFNASTVALAEHNLIEASAGTGKTYSIAVLVLRLLLEKEIKIQEILMVTFTKAAVAELEERIRLFVRLAYKVAQGETIKDDTITKIVNNVKGKNAEQIKEILKTAVLFLDETSVLTIHSFCQQTLNEFAFETNQLFGVDLMQDSSAILEDETNRFWRKNVTCIPSNLLALFLNHGLDKNTIKTTVSNHLAGKSYLTYNAAEDYNFTEQSFKNITEELKKQQFLVDEQTKNLYKYIQVNRDNLIAQCEGNASARKSLLPVIDDVESFLAAIEKSKTTKYVTSLFPEILEQQKVLSDLVDSQSELIKSNVKRINCNGITQIGLGINTYKSRYNQITFDDLITKLHQAFYERPSKNLQACLQQKYKAVFVDEFQDTDRLQFEIFEKAFAENTILFYIGDPKQSIYAWRKADIFTYFKAKDAVDNLYGMNQNFRSSEQLIKAMNVFFLPTPDFETFYFKDCEQKINYIPVASPKNNTKGNLYHNNKICTPIQITDCAKKDDVFSSLTEQILEILNNKDYQISVDGKKRNVLPQDIGILIRTNKEGVQIKKSLSRYGIPAITIDDGRVLQSHEAVYLLYLLQAIADINRANINKALLSPFTTFKEENILALNNDLVIERFRAYKVSWEQDGVYAALKLWISDFDIQSKLLSGVNSEGERLITNLYQLLEILHKTQTRKNLNSLELISWLKRGIEGMETEGDEFEQRIENDEEAIKIVTIHKSKGLEYKIVFAPTLDMNADSKHNDVSFRTTDKGYVSAEKKELSTAQREEAITQAEQENRRLIYVAVTRTVSQCYIYRINNSYYKTSSLSYFTNVLKDINQPELIAFSTGVTAPSEKRYYQPEGSIATQTEKKPFEFQLLQQNWRRMSYSMLSANHSVSLKLKSAQDNNDYDDFIFNQLKKGVKTGNMLHFIFENIYFHDQTKWPSVIEEAIKRYVPKQEETYQPMLMRMLNHVLGATITIDDDEFKLADVSSYKCIHELEFDFNVSDFIPAHLNQLSTDDMLVDAKPNGTLEGIMNGKIDLFFEHKNKYYVLDWKSNFLGDAVSNYDKDSLTLAMNENNYHLQYLIYSLAVKKYLESRILNFNFKYQFGGVIYLFVRGMRSDLQTGIFTAKPDIKTIGNLNARLTDYAS